MRAALVAVALLGAGLAGDAASSPGAPIVALVGGVPGATSSALYLVTVGAHELPSPMARFDHLPGAVLRARVVGRDVLVVADRTPARDLSWAAELVRIDDAGRVAVLCDRVMHASRPLVTASGRVFVERGVAGPALEGRLRVDALTVEEITVAGPRVVYSWSGYTTHLAGVTARGELLVYRVGPASGDLVALDPDSGRVREIAASIGSARDFSVEGDTLVFAQREAIVRVDLATGVRAAIATTTSGHPAPHVWPGGRVAWNPDGDAGLAIVGGERVVARQGVDVVSAIARDGRHAALLHYAPEGGIPTPWLVRVSDGMSIPLPIAPGVRLEIGGIL